MLIDSHCHFNSLDESIRQKIANTYHSDYYFIDSSIDLESSQIAVELAKKYDFLYTSLGFHPFSAAKFSGQILAAYHKLIDDNKKIVAIGEIGLDYKSDCAYDKQKEALSSFLQLAQERNLAVLIHNRMPQDSEEFKILEIIDRYFKSYEKVVFHCFSYSLNLLNKILERNGMISFSLNILRKKDSIIESLKECPLNNLLLETDSPYMRINGIDSKPSDISLVYSLAASVKNISDEELRQKVFLNAKKVFRI
jgi:TatD DNase family protein